MTALAKRWHSDHNTFHLDTSEMTVTSEDVYRILGILVVGELVVYDHTEQGGIEVLKRIFDNDGISGYEIPW